MVKCNGVWYTCLNNESLNRSPSTFSDVYEAKRAWREVRNVTARIILFVYVTLPLSFRKRRVGTVWREATLLHEHEFLHFASARVLLLLTSFMTMAGHVMQGM